MIRQHENLFIGSRVISTTLNYYGTDFITNPKFKHDYNGPEINYSFNRFGHRTIELDKLQTNNYILAVGCSHTMGVGIPENTRYSTVVANMLGCDEFNLGVGATGVDVALFNLIKFKSLNLPPPRAVLLQLSGKHRSIVGKLNNDKDLTLLNAHIDDHSTFVTAGDQCGYFDFRIEMVEHLVKSLFSNVVVIEFFDHNMQKYDVKVNVVDSGRDPHFGIRTHYNLAVDVISFLKSNHRI